MKKKFQVKSKDRKDWIAFTKQMSDISVKEADLMPKVINKNNIPKLDLHNCSLIEANHAVENFINTSFDNGYKKILIVTGKGLRSKTRDNPYISEKLSILKNSVPEFINRNKSLLEKISAIKEANFQDGGKGAIYIFLKNTIKFIK